MSIEEKKKKTNFEKVTEDYSLQPVPEEKRHNWRNVFFVWVCYNVVIGDMATGVALGTNMDFKTALIALTIGDLALLIVMGLTAYVGAKTGLAAMPLFRLTAGKVGAIIASIIIIFTSTGWFGVQLGFFGQIWAQYLPFSENAIAFAGGLLMMTTAVVGYKGLALISKISAIPLLIFILGGLIVSLSTVGIPTLLSYSPEAKEIGSIAVGISTVFGSWATGAALMPDVSRYAKNDILKIFLLWAGALFLGHYLLPIAGIAFALIQGTWNFGEIAIYVGRVALGSGIIGAIVISLAQWTTNDNNLYSASLAFNNIIETKKWKLALILGLVGTYLGYSGFVNYFVNYMILLGTVVPPMAALLISDYVVIPLMKIDESYDYNNISYSNVPFIKWTSIIAWALGVIIAITFPGVAAINGIIATIIIHVILTKITHNKQL